ncbi:VOC family protein [Kineosporia babensis]
MSFLSLIVRDVVKSRAFYVEQLGWPVELEVPDEVVMIRVGEKLVLSLWQESAAVQEIGPIARGEGALPFTLAHNVASPAEVDQVIAEAKAAGGTVVVEPASREWGGYSGYFADPDGFRWEVAYNPGEIGASVL